MVYSCIYYITVDCSLFYSSFFFLLLLWLTVHREHNFSNLFDTYLNESNILNLRKMGPVIFWQEITKDYL